MFLNIMQVWEDNDNHPLHASCPIFPDLKQKKNYLCVIKFQKHINRIAYSLTFLSICSKEEILFF